MSDVMINALAVVGGWFVISLIVGAGIAIYKRGD